MAGIMSILTLIILAVWQMTKNWLIGAVLEIGAAAGCICVYVARPEILENALSTVLEKFVLTEVFTDIRANLKKKRLMYCAPDGMYLGRK